VSFDLDATVEGQLKKNCKTLYRSIMILTCIRSIQLSFYRSIMITEAPSLAVRVILGV